VAAGPTTGDGTVETDGAELEGSGGRLTHVGGRPTELEGSNVSRTKTDRVAR
jgi:hypothetical protein